MKSKACLLILCALLLLTSLSCSMGGFSFNGKSITMTVTISEEQLNILVSSAAEFTGEAGNSAENVLENVDKIELHDGYMRIFGSTTVNGDSVSGSVDVSLSASDGAIQAQITRVDIPGKSIDDPAIQQANEEIARQLTSIIQQGDVTFKEVTVKEDELSLKIKAKVIDIPGSRN